MTDIVEIDIRDRIADVRLNRPEKYNALSPEMFREIAKAGESLAGQDDLRAVVLSGAGRGFCAGLDFASFQQMETDGPEALGSGEDKVRFLAPLSADNPANRAQWPAYVWKKIPVPTIAALHGVVYGGGLQIALGTDIRIATPDARLSIMEVQWGLIPDMSLTQTLRDLVSLDVAKELTFTGRVVDATEAQRLGLVTRIAEGAHAAALELAREIAARSPDAIRAGKRLLEENWNAEEAAGLALEASLNAKLIGSPNQVEAVRANMEGRAANFS